ncbi:hypothetical protein COCON_G00219680 [Conger conger]|uniref:Uncharacterized protein n=1 Tax=Conger conger TaxID=82655 RepID=A0A9Q1CYM5_CONCO|nr:hypothetical protein COCON_G00219680 [Conger conger]
MRVVKVMARDEETELIWEQLTGEPQRWNTRLTDLETPRPGNSAPNPLSQTLALEAVGFWRFQEPFRPIGRGSPAPRPRPRPLRRTGLENAGMWSRCESVRPYNTQSSGHSMGGEIKGHSRHGGQLGRCLS